MNRLASSALLSAYDKAWWPVALYMMGMSLVSLVAVQFAPETLNRDLARMNDATAD